VTEDEKDALWSEALDAAHAFGKICAKVRDIDPFPGDADLEVLINYLMTELWDQNFSQTEIRKAFESSTADMNRYAAGSEQRSLEKWPGS
jgi:hypothetical protein